MLVLVVELEVDVVVLVDVVELVVLLVDVVDVVVVEVVVVLVVDVVDVVVDEVELVVEEGQHFLFTRRVVMEVIVEGKPS